MAQQRLHTISEDCDESPDPMSPETPDTHQGGGSTYASSRGSSTTVTAAATAAIVAGGVAAGRLSEGAAPAAGPAVPPMPLTCSMGPPMATVVAGPAEGMGPCGGGGGSSVTSSAAGSSVGVEQGRKVAGTTASHLSPAVPRSQKRSQSGGRTREMGLAAPSRVSPAAGNKATSRAGSGQASRGVPARRPGSGASPGRSREGSPSSGVSREPSPGTSGSPAPTRRRERPEEQLASSTSSVASLALKRRVRPIAPVVLPQGQSHVARQHVQQAAQQQQQQSSQQASQQQLRRVAQAQARHVVVKERRGPHLERAGSEQQLPRRSRTPETRSVVPSMPRGATAGVPPARSNSSNSSSFLVASQCGSSSSSKSLAAARPRSPPKAVPAPQTPSQEDQVAALWRRLEQVEEESQRRLQLMQFEAEKERERERNQVEALRQDNERLRQRVHELELAASSGREVGAGCMPQPDDGLAVGREGGCKGPPSPRQPRRVQGSGRSALPRSGYPLDVSEGR